MHELVKILLETNDIEYKDFKTQIHFTYGTKHIYECSTGLTRASGMNLTIQELITKITI